MLDSIAYIGYGFVGKACHKQFEHNAKWIIIDPKYYETTVEELAHLKPSLIFVSVSAPTLPSGDVDASAIYTIFQQLTDIEYKGIVVLKSTVTPDIAHDLFEKFGLDKALNKDGPLRYVYSPEFLREAEWETDAVEPRMMLFAGSFNDCEELKTIYRNHSCVPSHKVVIITDYRTAALAKYAINSFLATKVIFMNQMQALLADANNGKIVSPDYWSEFTRILASDLRIGYTHMDVPGNGGEYGYGGSCFPKDVRALIAFDKKGRLSLLNEVSEANMRIKLEKPK
jgi:UDPglucose 6-dehydrogenase